MNKINEIISNSGNGNNRNGNSGNTNNLSKKNTNSLRSAFFSKNISSNSVSYGYSGTKVIGIILLLIVIVLLSIGSYWLYNYYNTNATITPLQADVLTTMQDATSSLTVASGTIPTSSYSNEYAMSCWINIADYNYNYGKEKPILRRGDAGSGNPEILLDTKTNDLIVRVQLQKGGATVSSFQDVPVQLINTTDKQKESFALVGSSISNDSNDTNYSNTDINNNDVNFSTVKLTVNSDNKGIKGIDNSYFNMISGNSVTNESFTNIDDATNATIKVIIDICNIAKSLQSQQVADDSINYINSGFQSVLDKLEKLKTTAKSKDDVDAALEDIPTDTTILEDKMSDHEQYKTLDKDIAALSAYENVKITDYSAFVTTVNNQMKLNNCEMSISGTNDIDITISFYENIINLIKNSFLTYISNMGSSINQSCPDANSIINSKKDKTKGICVVKMIPLQKWVCVIVSVYNQVIDIYIDGQLSSSCILPAFPNVNSSADLTITPDGGFSGMISKVSVFNSAMTVQQAKSIYYSGPVYTTSILSSVPNWVYWSLAIFILILIIYSFFA